MMGNTTAATGLSSSIALSLADAKPYGTLKVPAALIVTLIAFMLICVVLVAAVIVLSLPKKPASRPKTTHGVHSKASGVNAWRGRIDTIVKNHADGIISRQEALTALARVARDFASTTTGKDMSSSTLLDLKRQPATQHDKDGMARLRTTIEALYPPEFANDNSQNPSDEASVEQAGTWVAHLVEMWR